VGLQLLYKFTQICFQTSAKHPPINHTEATMTLILQLFNVVLPAETANAMYTDFREQLCNRLAAINDAGLYNSHGTIVSADAVIETGGHKLLNFSTPAPFALNSCQNVGQAEGSQNETATALEASIARLLNADDCILYNSPSDANCALTNHLLGRADAVIYNALSQLALSSGATFCRATKYIRLTTKRALS